MSELNPTELARHDLDLIYLNFAGQRLYFDEPIRIHAGDKVSVFQGKLIVHRKDGTKSTYTPSEKP